MFAGQYNSSEAFSKELSAGPAGWRADGYDDARLLTGMRCGGAA